MMSNSIWIESVNIWRLDKHININCLDQVMQDHIIKALEDKGYPAQRSTRIPHQVTMQIGIEAELVFMDIVEIVKIELT